MKGRHESLQQRPLQKTISQRQHSVPREVYASQYIRNNHAARLQTKTEINDSQFLSNLHSFVTAVRDESPLRPIKKRSVDRLNPLSRNRLQVNRSQRQLLLQRGKSLYRDKQMNQAITIFKQLYKQQPRSELLFYIGSALVNKEQYVQAKQYLNDLITCQPTFNKDMYLLLSIAYKKCKQFREAVEVLKKGLAAIGEFEEAYQYLGKLHMKMKEFGDAQDCFNKCLSINSHCALSLIGLADTVRSQGRLQQAVCHYTQAICEDRKYHLVCLMKRMTAYYQLHRYDEAEMDTDELLLNKVQSSEVYYFKGMLLLNRQQSQQASVYFQQALRLNNVVTAVTKSLEELIKIQIRLRDFYQAAYQTSRVEHLNVNRVYLSNLCLFVEGVIDSIKKRYKDSIVKLGQVLDATKHSSAQCSYHQIINDCLHLYLAYSFFCSQDYLSALYHYQKITSQHSPSLLYNKCMCEGIIHHNSQKYLEAAEKFDQAKLHMNNRIEPYFYKAVNCMQQYYLTKASSDMIDIALKELQEGEKINSNNSLFYFYYSMLLLQRKKPQLYLILKAIDKSEDNIAEYYFVKAIIYCQNGNFEEGLTDFSNALVVDPNGTDFLKERSKCLYMLGRYEQAVGDIKKCLDVNIKDYEAKLLLCFYLYALQAFDEALELLNSTMENDSNDSPKIKTFINTLHFRVKDYKHAGVIGTVLTCMFSAKQIPHQIKEDLDTHINNNELMGEFQSGHLLSLKGLIHLYEQEYAECAYSLQRAMTEIKQNLQIDNDHSSIDSESELRIYEVKFNMIILTMCQKEFEKAETLTKMLIDDTQMTTLIDQLQSLQEFIQEAISQESTKPRVLSILLFDGRTNLLSQSFPIMDIALPKGYRLKTKPILFYPERLNFNITPEMSEDMLKCFTMDKIDDRPEPPWILRDQQNIFFTQNVEMRRSVCVSSTLQMAQPDTNEKLKLNEALEMKLNRIIHSD